MPQSLPSYKEFQAWFASQVELEKEFVFCSDDGDDVPLQIRLYRAFLLSQQNELPVQERPAPAQGEPNMMAPEHKVFRASAEEKELQNKVRENLERSAADSRRIEGLAKNAGTLNSNQTKHYQQLRNLIDQCIKDGLTTHEVVHRILKTVEALTFEVNQSTPLIMESLLKIEEKLGIRDSDFS